jgi:hypothetical protein
MLVRGISTPAAVSVGEPHHLPRVVDPVSLAIVSTKCAEVSHAYAISARDEGMDLPAGSPGVPYHLPRVVDPETGANASTECAETGYAYAIRSGDKSLGEIPIDTRYLSCGVDIKRVTHASAQLPFAFAIRPGDKKNRRPLGRIRSLGTEGIRATKESFFGIPRQSCLRQSRVSLLIYSY